MGCVTHGSVVTSSLTFQLTAPINVPYSIHLISAFLFNHHTTHMHTHTKRLFAKKNAPRDGYEIFFVCNECYGSIKVSACLVSG